MSPYKTGKPSMSILVQTPNLERYQLLTNRSVLEGEGVLKQSHFGKNFPSYNIFTHHKDPGTPKSRPLLHGKLSS